MASRAPRTRELSPVPKNEQPRETLRTLTAAELDYYRATLTEVQQAEQQFAQAQEGLIEARGAVKSLHRQFIRKYAIDPDVDGINVETGLIGPLTSPAPAEEAPAGEPVAPPDGASQATDA